MVAFSSILSAGLFVATVNGAPIKYQKRIAQVIADSTTKWVAACTAAGGADKCQPVSQTAFTALLAAGGNCDQQNAADAMIDLAKTLKNDAAMITAAQIFVQQPRNSPNSVSVPYCQTAPKNAELKGFFQCQFKGSDPTKFSGDQSGNKPLGVDNLNPAGSCPANTAGPIADGTQLSDTATSPGTPQGGGASAAAPAGGSNSTATADAGAADATSTSTDAADATASTDAAGSAAGADNAAADPAGAAGVNNAAADLSDEAADPSDAGADASATGAGGASTDAGAAATDAGSAATSTAAAAAATGSAAAGGDFKAKNGADAEAQNAQFASLTPDSPCTDGQQACVQGSFAQCVNSKFVLSDCAGGTTCQSLPLVNKAGTSITCSTAADAAARIATAKGSK